MKNGDHCYLDKYSFGVTYLNYPVTVFYRIEDKTSYDQLVRMSISLAHEAVHTFGMDDVYDKEEHLNNNEMCIMDYYNKNIAGDFYEAIKSGDVEPFCNSCMEKILEYTENLNILGN